MYDSYGEALALNGDHLKALNMYKKVLEMDPENKHAKTQIKNLEINNNLLILNFYNM